MEFDYRLVDSARRLADDLVKMHKDTAIEMEYWGNALEFVSQFYNVTLHFDKKESK
jgi:hypothetical protein